MSGSVLHERTAVTSSLSASVQTISHDLDRIEPSLDLNLLYDLVSLNTSVCQQKLNKFNFQSDFADVLFDINDPTRRDLFIKNICNDLGLSEELEEASPSPPQTKSIPISPQPSPIVSESSGYLSSTSSPSHSPPRSVELPEPIQVTLNKKYHEQDKPVLTLLFDLFLQVFNISNQRQLRPIMPNIVPESEIQIQFYAYIMSYGLNSANKNKSTFERSQKMIYNNPLLKLVSPLQDGDT